MGGRASRQQGDRIERELVALHREAGVEAQRVPLSGAAGGLYSGDLVIQASTGQLKAEVKARASGEGFKTLEGWLGGNDLLFLRRDRAAPLVVLPWPVYLRLLAGNQVDTEKGGGDYGEVINKYQHSEPGAGPPARGGEIVTSSSRVCPVVGAPAG